MHDFDTLVRNAESLPIEGWSFRAIEGRLESGGPPWNLETIFRATVRPDSRLLDLGTGGGEYLASLAPLPPTTFATEGYPPNLPVARARLGPLGVRVLPIREDQKILLPNDSVDLVLCRHEAFDPSEVARVSVPGGTFITQQVGEENYRKLHQQFGVPPEEGYNDLETLDSFADEVARAGFSIQSQREAVYPHRFLDVGAVVYFLRMAPWEVPGFSIIRNRPELLAIDAEISSTGYWELAAQRMLIVAVRNEKVA